LELFYRVWVISPRKRKLALNLILGLRKFGLLINLFPFDYFPFLKNLRGGWVLKAKKIFRDGKRVNLGGKVWGTQGFNPNLFSREFKPQILTL